MAAVQEIHEDVLAFMSQFNEIGDIHSQFLHQLIQHYINNWFGLANDRVLISAHPGMGKTTCLRFFMRWLLLELLQGNMPGGAKKGLLVCSNQIDELREHIEWLQHQDGLEALKSLVAIHHSGTGDQTGLWQPSSALESFPVIFTTQALIRRRTSSVETQIYRTSELSHEERKLHEVCIYAGSIRDLAWDELAITTRAYHLDVDDVLDLAEELASKRNRRRNQLDKVLGRFTDEVALPLAAAIDQLDLKEGESTTIAIPRLEAEDQGKAIDSFRSGLGMGLLGDRFLASARTLAEWPGYSDSTRYKTTKEGQGALMDFVIELPDELTRAVVTDASAAVHKLIQLDDTITQPPFILDQGPELKSYENLKLMTREFRSGKGAFLNMDGRIKNEWVEVIKETLRIVDDSLDRNEKALIITFKGVEERSSTRSVRHIEKIIGEMGLDPDRYDITTWGRHRGTNSFSQASAVLLFGTLHLDPGLLNSMARAATRDPLNDALQQESYTLQELCDSQTAADIQQALSRGRCREVMLVNGKTVCRPMLAFTALHKQEYEGVLKHLQTAFPGFTHVPLDEAARHARKTSGELGNLWPTGLRTPQSVSTVQSEPFFVR